MKKNTPKNNENRRNFLKKIGGATAAGLTVGTVGIPAFIGATAKNVDAQKRANKRSFGNSRDDLAYQVRVNAAQVQKNRPSVSQPVNGDETDYPNFIGNFTKALPHNTLGEVDVNAYNALVAATVSGNSADYAAIPMGGTAKLANPQAAHSYQLEGSDSHKLSMPAAPKLNSLMESAEILEVYWQAVTRDIPYSEYNSNPVIRTAIRELRRFPIFRGISTRTIFRGETPGDAVGNFISQFLLQPIPYGSTTIDQRYQTPVAGDNKIIDYNEWLNIQNGISPSVGNVFDNTPQYIRNGRDLGEYVHRDAPFQAYYNAALIMLGYGGDAISGTNPYKSISNQGGFVQFGAAHIVDMLSRVTISALKAAWFQKWNVHRRLRPEAYGGILHNQLTGATNYPIDTNIGNSEALKAIFSEYGNYLLPMAYPEGSPTHPAYPAGHATIAGACTTILKAFFNEDFEIPNPVAVSNDGNSLESYNEAQLKIGNELNKLAANISLGRDIAGVHWRTDGTKGILLGEEVAIQLLRDCSQTYAEDFGGFTFTKYNGSTITI